MQTDRRVAANPQTKPTDLGCESAERLAATIRSLTADTIAICVITQLVSWYSFYRLTEGGRLSRPRFSGPCIYLEVPGSITSLA